MFDISYLKELAVYEDAQIERVPRIFFSPFLADRWLSSVWSPFTALEPP